MSKKTEPESATNVAGTPSQQILQQVQAANIDSQTAAQFGGLTLVSQARTSDLQRQAASLTALHGAADSRVVALQASIRSEQSLASKLGVVRDQAATPTPAVPAGGWVLHGRVRDQNLQPVAKLSVLLVNDRKVWLRNYGFAFTDDTGYFLLSHSPAASDKNDTKTSSSVFLEVLDQKRQPLYIDASPFELAVGSVLYRDIVLSSQTPLGRPPQGVRSAPSTEY
jgi:hypothetical protein